MSNQKDNLHTDEIVKSKLDNLERGSGYMVQSQWNSTTIPKSIL